MSSPQTKLSTDPAEAMSNAVSAEAGAVSKQVIEADLNVAASNGDTNVSVDGVEVEASDRDENRKDADGTEHEYRVGDLVWAKIKSHPWWPGQIHNPKDASEIAVRPGQEGRLLVAFFGDGSFSWCLPSQVMPFVENFNRVSKDGTSKSFMNAVNKALDELSRVLDSYMTCSCVSAEKRDVISRPVVENAGVKAGVLVPDVDVSRLSLPDYEVSDVFSRLVSFAKNVPSESVLDLGLVRGWISAFHRSKGVDKLQEYEEPVFIEGLEDDSSDKGTSDDFSVPTVVPLGPGPHDDEDDDDGPSSPNSSASVDKLRRRRKSMNDIMAESVSVSPKRRKRTSVKYVEMPVSGTMKKSNVTDKDGAGSSGKKNDKGKAKTADEVSNVARSGDGVGNSKRKPKTIEAVDTKDTTEPKAGSSGKKKNDTGKVKDAESPKTADEVGSNVARSGDGNSKRKPKTIEAVNTKDNTGSDEVREEGDGIILTPRERKRSKYLSNPYVEPISRVGSSSFKKGSDASKDAKTEGEGERAVITTKPAEDRSVDEAKEGDIDSDMDITLSSLRSKVDSPVKKAKPSKTLSPEKAKSPERENPKAAKETKGKMTESSAKTSNTEKSQEKTEKSVSKKSAESSQANEKASSALVLSFALGFPLPSKDEILNVYSKFGRLNRRETDVFVDSHSVQIAFKKVEDAETAFKSSVSENPFGAESITTHWLRHGSRARGPHLPERRVDQPEGSDKAVVVDDALSEMNLIRNKLEITDAVLGAYHGKFAEADKETLKVEFRNLKEKVEAVCKRVNELAEGTKLSKERGE